MNGLGLYGDQQVGIVAAQRFTVVKTALQRRPGSRVHWRGLWLASQPNAVPIMVGQFDKRLVRAQVCWWDATVGIARVTGWRAVSGRETPWSVVLCPL